MGPTLTNRKRVRKVGQTPAFTTAHRLAKRIGKWHDNGDHLYRLRFVSPRTKFSFALNAGNTNSEGTCDR